jgi:hypothetical protein
MAWTRPDAAHRGGVRVSVQRNGEPDQHRGAICETAADVGEFFGHGRLAKQVLWAAGIECVEVIR